MPFYQLDDVFGYQDANEIKCLWADNTQPLNPGEGEVWLDTSSNPCQLKRYTAEGWEIIGEMTSPQVLDLLKAVDGSGSGLDADMLDGNEGDYYAMKFYKPTDGNVTLDQYPEGLTLNEVDNDAPGWPLTSGICVTAKNGLYRCCQLFFTSSGVLKYIRGYRSDNGFTSWYKIWSEHEQGSGSGLDADTLDGLDSTSFVRSDADDLVAGHTGWQDNCQLRLGTDEDLLFFHDGTDSFIDNNTGQFYLRQSASGLNMRLQAKDSSGTTKTLLELDPESMGGSVWLPNPGGALYIGEDYNMRLFHNGTDSIIRHDSVGKLIFSNRVNGSMIDFYADNNAGTTLQMLRIDPDSLYVGIGNDVGLRLFNDGSMAQLISAISPLRIRSTANGESIDFVMNDAGGTGKTMLLLDPDTEEATIMGNTVWHAGNDGSGSGLDADLLDGVEPDVNASGDTIVKRHANGYIYATYFNTTAANAVNTPTHLYGSYDTFIRKITPTQLLEFLAGSDGMGSGLDADFVDGIHASQFIRSDTSDNVSGHTEWQDNYQVRLGNDADVRMYHNGTNSYILNYTGGFYFYNYSNGGVYNFQARNSSGVDKTMLTCKPDSPCVQSAGAFISDMTGSFEITNGTVHDTGIPIRSTGYFMIRNNTAALGCIFAIAANTNVYSQRVAGSTFFTSTMDTADRTNVYFDGGTLKVQNLTGSNRNYQYGFFGMRFG